MINPMKPKHHRDTEARRTTFRAFRVFRSYTFLAFLFLAAPLLLAPAPALAQSPAILLDIKSPATTSPPSESLLTLDEEGDLWIKGQLNAYLCQAEVDLDPQITYWVVRDPDSKVLLALELYNSSTQTSSGNLYVRGGIAPWEPEADQPSALLRYTNALNTVVFSLSSTGDVKLQGSVADPLPPDPKYAKMPLSMAGQVVPQPMMQGRVFCPHYCGLYPAIPMEEHAVCDVTNRAWRYRYYPQDYGQSLFSIVSPGFRYRGGTGGESDLYYLEFQRDGSNYYLWEGEPDVQLVISGTTGLIQPGPASYQDGTWQVIEVPPIQKPRTEAPQKIAFSMLDMPPETTQWPGSGFVTDNPTGAVSRVYLYDVAFTHPDRIPRGAPVNPANPAPDDPNRPVTIGVDLRPAGTIGFNHLKLCVYEQVQGSETPWFRIFDSDSPSISASWDGKVYPDGIPGPTKPFHYSWGCCVRMQAEVTWEAVSSPPQVWENGSDAFHAAQLELFLNEACTVKLNDYPQEGSSPRKPMYMLSQNDGIYVRVTRPGYLTNLPEPFLNVQITSESDPAGVTISLPQVSPGVYKYQTAAGGFLRLGASSNPSGSPARVIKLTDEEVLTFKLEELSTDENTTVQVMVDSCEAGIEWQVDYPTYDPVSWGHSIAYAQDYTVGFYNSLGTVNQVWRKNFNNGDLASMKSHFAAATDSAYADSVDIVMWAGHGPVENGPYMRFFVDLVGGVKQPADRLYWTDASWGENDVEWVVLNTCSFLNGTDAELKQMAKGVHLICGYVTTMEMMRDGGTYFSQKLREMSIREAWFDQADEYQDSGRVARVFGATTCMGDSLGSTGPILTSRDPNEQSTYTHEDHVVVQ